MSKIKTRGGFDIGDTVEVSIDAEILPVWKEVKGKIVNFGKKENKIWVDLRGFNSIGKMNELKCLRGEGKDSEDLSREGFLIDQIRKIEVEDQPTLGVE